MRTSWRRVALAAMATSLVGLTAGGAAMAKEYTIAFVPKLVGIPYFTAMYQGMQKAAKRFGVKVIYEGPTTATVSGQAEYVKALIAQHVSAVGVSANSPTALNPLVAQARKAGVVFYASDSDVSSPLNDLWVQQAPNQDIGYDCVDIIAQELHGKGQIAIISGGPTATNLNTWIRFMKERLKKYPGLKVVSIQYAGESITQATKDASQVIAAYPHLRGIIGVNSTAVPGAAQAVDEAGKKGQIAVTGVTDPNTIRPYILNGTVQKVVLWNPVNLGYLTVWGVLQILEHHPFKIWNDVPGLGKVKYYPQLKMLMLGPPLIIDRHNVNLNF